MVEEVGVTDGDERVKAESEKENHRYITPHHTTLSAWMFINSWDRRIWNTMVWGSVGGGGVHIR